MSFDEDVAGRAGDDEESGLSVVLGTDADPVATAGVSHAVGDDVVVELGGGAEGTIGGSVLGGLPHAGAGVRRSMPR